MTPFDPADVLSLPLTATLSTLAEDGAPRNAPVWFAWEEGALWMLGSEGGSSVRRLSRDPRCAVEIVHHDNARGILLHLGFRGRAGIQPMDPARFRRLLTRYLGAERDWNPWFIETVARIDDPAGRLIRLHPDSTFTNNVSHFRTGPHFAWPPERPGT